MKFIKLAIKKEHCKSVHIAQKVYQVDYNCVTFESIIEIEVLSIKDSVCLIRLTEK